MPFIHMAATRSSPRKASRKLCDDIAAAAASELPSAALVAEGSDPEASMGSAVGALIEKFEAKAEGPEVATHPIAI